MTQTHSTVTGVIYVTIGSMIANIASYLLHLPAGRWLGPEEYGVFASLLATQLVLTVPAIALQMVIARELVKGLSVRVARSLIWRTLLAVIMISLLAWPAIAAILHVGLWSTFGAVSAAPMFVLLYGEQGFLQGQSRFYALGWMFGFAGIAKIVPAIAALALGCGPGIALFASTCGTALIVVGARFLLHSHVVEATSSISVPVLSKVPCFTEKSQTIQASEVLLRQVIWASQMQLVLVGMMSLDLLLARHELTAQAAGLYALGNIATKVAFWLPQAIGTVFYPRMAHPEHSLGALRTALAVLIVLGVVLVVGAAVASPLILMFFGESYREVLKLLPLFALQGAALAVVQISLLAAVAHGYTRLAGIVWVLLCVELVALLVFGSTVNNFIVIAAGIAVLCAIVVSISASRLANNFGRNPSEL